MVRRWIWIIAAFLVSGWPWSLCSAETITLKSGRTIEGTVIEKTDEYIKVDSDGKIWKVLYRQMDQQAVDRMQGRDEDRLEGKPAVLPQESNETGLFPISFDVDLLPLGSAPLDDSSLESSPVELSANSSQGSTPWDSCIHGSNGGMAFFCADELQKQIDDAALELIGQSYSSSISELNLQYTRITDNGLQYLAAWSKLVSIDFEDALITGEGLRYIRTLPQLKFINLEGTRITSAAIQALEGMESLVVLKLKGTSVDDAVLEYLEKIPNLEELNLGVTLVTDASVDRLGALKNLKILYVGESRISEKGIQNLRRMLPACQINLPVTQGIAHEYNKGIVLNPK